MIETLRQRRGFLLPVLVALLGLAVWLAPAISQPPDYHDWADQRTFLGIPNAFDLASNLGFLLVGLYGLWSLFQRQCCCLTRGETLAWSLMFIGVCLTAMGSAWYHWAPDNTTLLWDRLPMAWAFMALLSALLIERVDRRLGLALLPLLITLGLASVLAWYWSETAGHSDLRPYLLALLAEWLDAWLFALTGVISGHSIKHLIAALAIYWLLHMLRRRRPLGRD